MSHKIDIGNITSILVHIDGPTDRDVYNTAKFKHEQRKALLEKLYKNGAGYIFSQEDKNIVIDALRIFLEGISDYDVGGVTGKEKEHFLNLYSILAKEWKLDVPKLKRQSYDTPEYQKIATKSGLMEE